MYVICNYIMSHLLLQVPPLESSVVSWANVSIDPFWGFIRW